VVMKKCTLCFDRLPVGGGPTGFPDPGDPLLTGSCGLGTSFRPACQVACPTGAIFTHLASVVVARANARLAWLHGHGYPDAELYGGPVGAATFGRTSVMWILPYPCEVCDLCCNPKPPGS
jgi:ferredoxin